MSGNMKNKTRLGAGTPKRAEDTQAQFDTATLSDTQFTTPTPGGQRSISELLGVGAENGITRRELERLTGLDGRSVRLLIERERREGVPILSDNASGYFLPASEDERAGYVRSMRHRAAEILTTARAVELAEMEELL